jgi:flagellar biosynthetic protein FliS
MSREMELLVRYESRERPLAMLFETVLRDMRLAAEALEAGRSSEAADPLARATDLVVELHSTLDRSGTSELSNQLGQVYRFASSRLLKATASRDARFVRDAERAIAPVAAAFGEANAEDKQ